jgi:APA family basic amino acid/polyamine antiporter
MGVGWGTAGALLAVACIAVSGFGYINGGVMIAGELAYSMALRGELPRVLARTGRDNAPVIAQMVGTALTIALMVANMAKTSAALFAFMALLTTSATLWLYLLAALAALKLRPGAGPALLVSGGLLFTLFAFYGSGWEANAWSLALLAAGLVIYATMKLSSSGSTNPAAADARAAPPGSAA